MDKLKAFCKEHEVATELIIDALIMGCGWVLGYCCSWLKNDYQWRKELMDEVKRLGKI